MMTDLEIDMVEDPSNELCYRQNPELWKLFCLATNRNANQPNYVWTVEDVIQFLESKIKGSRNHDPR